jgi:predicted peptidase
MTEQNVYVYNPTSLMRPESVPPGRYSITAMLDRGKYMPASTNVEVISGKTAKVKMQVSKAKQRIIFSIPSNSKFSSLDKTKAWLGYSLVKKA